MFREHLLKARMVAQAVPRRIKPKFRHRNTRRYPKWAFENPKRGICVAASHANSREADGKNWIIESVLCFGKQFHRALALCHRFFATPESGVDFPDREHDRAKLNEKTRHDAVAGGDAVSFSPL